MPQEQEMYWMNCMMRFKECDSAAGQQVVVKIRIMSLTDLSTAR